MQSRNSAQTNEQFGISRPRRVVSSINFAKLTLNFATPRVVRVIRRIIRATPWHRPGDSSIVRAKLSIVRADPEPSFRDPAQRFRTAERPFRSAHYELRDSEQRFRCGNRAILRHSAVPELLRARFLLSIVPSEIAGDFDELLGSGRRGDLVIAACDHEL